MPCSTISHEKVLHNYSIPCLYLRKTHGNFGKSSEISANFRKHRKRLKPIFEEIKRFMKLLENFGNSSKVFSRYLYDFLKFSENLPKSSETISGCEGVEEFRSWLLRSPQMDHSKLLLASNDGKVEWNTTRCILPVAYRRICNGNPGL